MELMRGWPDGFVDGIISSPPFRDADVPCEYWDWLIDFTNECQRVSRDYVLLINSSRRLKDILRKTDPIRVLIWDKKARKTPFRYSPIFVYQGKGPAYNFNNACWSDNIPAEPIIRFPNETTARRGRDFNSNSKESCTLDSLVLNGKHPFEDPVRLYQILCRFLKKGGSHFVCDPCLGSGTTLIACANLGLRGIGIEKEHQYVELARKRVSQYLGQERLFGGEFS